MPAGSSSAKRADGDDLEFIPGDTILTPSAALPNLVIAPGALATGATYVIRLITWNSRREQSEVDVSLVTNISPYSGDLVATPTVGEGLTLLFDFTAKNWLDDTTSSQDLVYQVPTAC